MRFIDGLYHLIGGCVIEFYNHLFYIIECIYTVILYRIKYVEIIMWLYISVFLVIVAILFYAYRKKTKPSFIENNEFTETAKHPTGDVYIFYTLWCPHCKTALEKLRELKNKYIHLSFTEIDADKNEDMANDYEVDSYPTIVLLYKNEKYIYDAELEASTFDLFIKTIMK
jgi:thiol-disulfide isomerase/thioredoxin